MVSLLSNLALMDHPLDAMGLTCSPTTLANGNPIPDGQPLPSMVFTIAKIFRHIHGIRRQQIKYLKICKNEETMRLHLLGALLNQTLGQMPMMQLTAFVLEVISKALVTAEKLDVVYTKWNALYDVWADPHEQPADSQESALEFQRKHLIWRVTELWAKFVPFANSLWDLSIAYENLLEAYYRKTQDARDEAVNNLFLNAMELRQKLDELRKGRNKEILGKVLEFSGVRKSAEAWIGELETHLERVDLLKATATQAQDMADQAKNTLACGAYYLWNDGVVPFVNLIMNLKTEETKT